MLCCSKPNERIQGTNTDRSKSLTVVPEADTSVPLVRAARAVGSAVAGRWALLDRLGSVVVDALVAVAGRTGEGQECRKTDIQSDPT